MPKNPKTTICGYLMVALAVFVMVGHMCGLRIDQNDVVYVGATISALGGLSAISAKDGGH